MRTTLLGLLLLSVGACHRPASPGTVPQPEPEPPPQPQATASAEPRPAQPPTEPSTSPPSMAAPQGMTGTWAGTYFFDDDGGTPQPPVYFFAELVFDGQDFTGQIVEPNTFGDQSEPELHAAVAGSTGPAHTIAFLKTYDGRGGVRHSVLYKGTLDPSSLRAQGQWFVRDERGGTFVMSRQARRGGLAHATEDRTRPRAPNDRPWLRQFARVVIDPP